MNIILKQYPALGNLTVHGRYQEGGRLGAVTSHAPDLDNQPAPTYLELSKPASASGQHDVGTIMCEDRQLSKESSASDKPFHCTLVNYGNTCFFNSLLQLIASIPSFIAQILDAALPPDHNSGAYCLAFLKLFIPAITSLSSDPSRVLEIPLVSNGDWCMSEDDWKDFVCRLAVRYDPNYITGALADPGDLLDYFMLIVPGVACTCETKSETATTHSCQCLHKHEGVDTVCEYGFTISVNGDDPLSHHITKLFNLESLSNYRCDNCCALPTADSPAILQRPLLSLPRFLRVSITSLLTSQRMQEDLHKHGPLQEFEQLNLSQLALQYQSVQGHYVL